MKSISQEIQGPLLGQPGRTSCPELSPPRWIGQCPGAALLTLVVALFGACSTDEPTTADDTAVDRDDAQLVGDLGPAADVTVDDTTPGPSSDLVSLDTAAELPDTAGDDGAPGPDVDVAGDADGLDSSAPDAEPDTEQPDTEQPDTDEPDTEPADTETADVEEEVLTDVALMGTSLGRAHRAPAKRGVSWAPCGRQDARWWPGPMVPAAGTRDHMSCIAPDITRIASDSSRLAAGARPSSCSITDRTAARCTIPAPIAGAEMPGKSVPLSAARPHRVKLRQRSGRSSRSFGWPVHRAQTAPGGCSHDDHRKSASAIADAKKR